MLRNKSGMNVDAPTSKIAPEKRKRHPRNDSYDASSEGSDDEKLFNLKRIAATLPLFTDQKRNERPACPPSEPPQSIENYLDLDEIDSASSSDSEDITQRTRNSRTALTYRSSSLFSPVARRHSTETDMTPFTDSEQSASQLELTEDIEEQRPKTGMQYD